MLPTKFQVNWPFGSGEKSSKRFSIWRPSWISIGTILVMFDLQVFLMLPVKFRVNWSFGSVEEAKKCFLRWRPSWISVRTDFSYFWCTCHPDASYQVSSLLAQGCRKSGLLKQLLTPHDRRRNTDDGHWLTTIAHLEHFVLRWTNNYKRKCTCN